MNIWLTGEGGSLATALAVALIGDKDVKVLKAPELWRKHVSHHHGEKEVDIMAASFEHRMLNLLDPRPDVIVHFAAVVNTDKCEHRPQECIDVNVEGTRRVMEVCKKMNCKMLYISTTATYDVTVKRPYVETSAQNPMTIYGITKYAGELLVRNQTQVPWVVIRPCFILGNAPTDHSSQLVRVAMHSALKKLWPEKAGVVPQVTLNPFAMKDYMPIGDFSNALIAVLRNWAKVEGQVFNVSNMCFRPMGVYFEYLKAFMHDTQEIEMEMGWLPARDYMGDHIVDSTKLRKATGWKPTGDIEKQICLLASTAAHIAAKAKKHNLELFYE